jgi:hypothetical protein
MSTALAQREKTGAVLEQVVIQGDLSKLSSVERVAYYNRVCESLGLNPFTRPFEYVKFQGREILYARKDATDQLRALRKVSLTITSRETLGDVYVVTTRAETPDGRSDEEIGAVNIKGLAGEALANAYMKATTKAKRRVTLSICGLGWLDETEVETIPGAEPTARYPSAGVRDTPQGRVVEATGELLPPDKPALPPGSDERAALIQRYGEVKVCIKALGGKFTPLKPDMDAAEIRGMLEVAEATLQGLEQQERARLDQQAQQAVANQEAPSEEEDPFASE